MFFDFLWRNLISPFLILKIQNHVISHKGKKEKKPKKSEIAPSDSGRLLVMITTTDNVPGGACPDPRQAGSGQAICINPGKIDARF